MSMLSASLRSLVRTGTASTSRIRTFGSTARKLEHYLDADKQTFDRVITAKDNVVLVDFYADWCGPCKMLSPVLEKLTTDDTIKTGGGQTLDLMTVDVDEQSELAQKYKVRSLPTVIAFRDGKQLNSFMGAMPEDAVRKFIASLS